MTIPTLRSSTKDMISLEKNNFKSLLEKIEKETKLKLENANKSIKTKENFFPKVNKALSNKTLRINKINI